MLTNAMQPMQRPRIKRGLIELNRRFGAAPDLRVSLDHSRPRPARGRARVAHLGQTLAGLDWLAAQRLQDRDRRPHVLGRKRGGSARRLRPADRRARLADRCQPPGRAVLLPEMDGSHDVPGDHHPLLGHPEQEPRRHDVRVQPHGGEAAGRGSADGGALHAHPLRSGLRHGRDAGRGGARPTAACSPPAPSSCATRTARNSACWAAAAARRRLAGPRAVARDRPRTGRMAPTRGGSRYFFTSASRISLR